MRHHKAIKKSGTAAPAATAVMFSAGVWICAVMILLLCQCASATAERTGDDNSASRRVKEHPENFIVKDQMTDGEFERRIHYNGLKGKETSLTPEFGKSPVTLWQLTDGIVFYQIIYNDGYAEMVDCEIVRQRGLIESFIRKFDKESDILIRRNSSTHPPHLHHHQYRLPHVTEHEFNDYLANEVMPFGYQMSFADEEEFNDINRIIRRDQVYFTRNVTYERLSDYTDLPDELLELLNFKSIRSQCDDIHQRMKDIAHGLNSDDEDHKQNATEKLNRHKRAISDLFLAPNTKWCGKGQAAYSYKHLGGASRADKCCRKHDHCKLNIYAMTSKWHLFNYRPFTISHCHCDRRFRTCLKMADSSDANLVGNLFFNIVQTKCFVLKPEKYCKSYNVFKLKCDTKGIRKRAHLRDNRKF